MQPADFDEFLDNLQAKLTFSEAILHSFQQVLQPLVKSEEISILNVIDACHKTKQKDLIDKSPAILGIVTGKPLLVCSEEEREFIKSTLMNHVFNRSTRLCAYNIFALCSALCNERCIPHKLPYNINLSQDCSCPLLVETVLKQKITTCPVCEPNHVNQIYSAPRVSALMGHFDCMRKALKSEIMKDHHKALYNNLLLYCAVKGGNLECVKYLCQLMGCKMPLFTAYYFALQHKNVDLLQYLLSTLEPVKMDEEALEILTTSCEEVDFQDGTSFFHKNYGYTLTAEV